MSYSTGLTEAAKGNSDNKLRSEVTFLVVLFLVYLLKLT